MVAAAISPNPRTLLLPDEQAIPSVLSDKLPAIFAGAIGFIAVCTVRYLSRRPVLSGIQHHLLAAAGLGIVGKYAQTRYDLYNMERDAIYRHYIELHPDDFPMPERVKVGDVFKGWTPVR